MAVLVILTTARLTAATEEMQLDPKVGKLPAAVNHSTDAADGATPRIGSVLNKRALQAAPKKETARRPWRTAAILGLAALFVLHKSTAAAQITLKRRIEQLPDELFLNLVDQVMEVDAKKGAVWRIGSVLDYIAKLEDSNGRAARRLLGAELAFTRWLNKQECTSGDNEPLSALECARKCDVLFFGWSDEHVSQLKLVVKSSLLSSKFPMVVSVGPEGWLLRNYRAKVVFERRCVVNPLPPRPLLLLPWTRHRVERLYRMVRDPATELGSLMHLERLELDVSRSWSYSPLREPIGHQVADKQLAYIVKALLSSPAVTRLTLTWSRYALYPVALLVVDHILALKDSRVTHLQIVETGTRVSVEREAPRELLPSLVEHAHLGNWKSIRSVAVKWTSPNEPERPMLRFEAFRMFTERLPNLYSGHLEHDYLPLDEPSLEFLQSSLQVSGLAGLTQSFFCSGTFVGVAPNAVGAAANGPSYALRLMLPWLDADGNRHNNLVPLGAEALRQASTLTLYAARPIETAPARLTEDLAIEQAEELTRLVVESGQDGVFCNQIVQRLPIELPASTRHLVLRTFDLSAKDDVDDAQHRLEAILAGNPNLSSVTVGLHLPCSDSPAAMKHLVRIAKALRSRIGPTAVRVELGTCNSRVHLLNPYSTLFRAFAPLAVVRRSAQNIDDMATRLHSGSLMYP